MFRGIDFFSDTVTRPSAPMRKAMLEAEVGDEQLGEDPTTRALEDRVAALLGKTAAYFLPTATMANEIALRLHCQPGDEVICAENCHLLDAECGGPAVHAQAITRPLSTPTGLFTAEQVKEAFVWQRGPHHTVSRLLSLENTANMGGGIAWPEAQLRAVVSTAKELGLKLHLDGARLFNASVKSGLSPKQLAEGFDTVTLCLSKGLGCPMGAVLAFDESQRPAVQRFKQLFGGGLRQSGFVAAAGLYALDHHVERLAEDHRHATQLAAGLVKLPNLRVENPEPSTNMVFFHWQGPSPDAFERRFLERGLRFSRVGRARFRAVTHLDVSGENVEKALGILREICAEK